jgi:hypothetical protein
MPSAFTVSHAVAVAKIVIATVAVETVVVVEPIVSAGMAKASVVKKTLGCQGALVEDAGREHRVADLCKNSARRDE